MTQNKLHSSDERRACSENSEISPRTDTQHTSSQNTTNAVDQSATTTPAQTAPPELSEPPAHPKYDARSAQQHMQNTKKNIQQNTAPNNMNKSTQHNNNSSTKTATVSQETSTPSSKSSNSAQNSAPAEAYSIDQFPHKITRKLILSIVAVGLMAFVGILTETMTNVLCPILMQQFHVETATVQWLTTGYLLMVSVVITVSSFFNKRFTNKTTFYIAITLCAIGLTVAALSVNFPMLMCARLIQGVGTGLALPLMFNIVLEQSPRQSLGLLMGFANMVCAVAPALGPTVGGVAVEFMDWHWIFAAMLPVLLVAFFLGNYAIETRHRIERIHFQALQLACLALAFASFVLALDRIGALLSAQLSGSPDVARETWTLVGLVVLCVIALVAFTRLCLRSKQPLLRLDVLRTVPFRWHLLAYVLLETVTIGLTYLITNMAQLGYGTSSLTAGLLILPGSLLGAVLAPVGGRLLDRFGAIRPIMIGSSVALLGMIIMLIIPGNVNIWIRCLGYIAYMAGFSVSFPNTMTSGLAVIPSTLHADGNAIFNTLQQLGGAVGTTVMALALSVAQANHGQPGSSSYMLATKQGGNIALVIVCICIFCAILANARAFVNEARHKIGLRS